MKTEKSPLRAFVSLCMLLVLLISAVSCEKKIDTMPSSQIADIILDEIDFNSKIELTGQQLSNHFDFPEGTLSEFSCYISTDEKSADEVGVFHLSSADKAGQAMMAISRHLTNRSDSFKETNKGEYDKLQTAVIRGAGSNIIILVVCNQNAKVASKLDSLGAVSVE